MDLGRRLLNPRGEGRGDGQGLHSAAHIRHAPVRRFDDELDRIATKVGSRRKAFQLAERDKALVRFYLPLEPEDPEEPVWSVIRTLSDKIGQELTSHLRDIAREDPLLEGIIDRFDFNATTHGQRDLDDDRLSNLIDAISAKRLGT